MDSSQSRPTLLVVDDTPHNLDIMVNLLSEKYRIKIATGGAKAIKIAKDKQTPDLILLDIMMPEMDGYEVIHKLKADPQTANIPVIFVTAMHEISDEKKGLELGAVDYITKPVNPPIVLARVDAQLKLANQRLALEDEVKKRTHELHLQNVQLEKELITRRELERQLSIQLNIQKASSALTKLQLKSVSTEQACEAIVEAMQLGLQTQQVALYQQTDDSLDLKIMSAKPSSSEVPSLMNDDLVESFDLSNELKIKLTSPDLKHVWWLWMKSENNQLSSTEIEQAIDILRTDIILLLRSSQLRESILEFDLT